MKQSMPTLTGTVTPSGTGMSAPARESELPDSKAAAQNKSRRVAIDFFVC